MISTLLYHKLQNLSRKIFHRELPAPDRKEDNVDYLTVKEVAELKGCSERYIQRLVKSNKMVAEEQINSSNNQICYLIAVSSLSDELQSKYYRQKRTEAGLLPEKEAAKEKKVEKPTAPQRSFEELSADERAEVNLWTDIVREWQGMRSAYKGSKTEFDKLYVGKCQLEHPSVKISTDILYRKWNAYRNNNIEGLIDKRGAWNRGSSAIPNTVWNAFLWYWLDDNRPTVSLSYRNTIIWTEEFYPELVSLIPTERAFRRKIDHDVKYALKTYMRDGEKAFHDRCMPYIIRMYDKLEANDCWIADNHTFDIISLDGKTKHRLYLTAFLDAKSGVLTGWNITDSPDSQSTTLALRHGILRFGIPKAVYVDNGREFLNINFGGKGNRTRKSDANKVDPTPILKRLGIEMHNAIVCNAQAKPIERTFCTVKNQFSKLWSGFCGGTILERKESLKRRIKNGDIPCDYEIREALDSWIDGEYNCQEYGGSERCFKGMTRIDVWNKTIKEVRKASPDVLHLLMMRSTRKQQIKRNGVCVTIAGEQIWFMHPEQTLMNLKKEVFVRYDPADLRQVRLYDAENEKFLFEWKNADYLMVDYLEKIQENIAEPQKRHKMAKKYIKEQAQGIVDNLTPEQRVSMVDISIQRAEQRKSEKFKIEMPAKIIPIVTNGEISVAKKAVGAEDIKVPINIKLITSNAAKRKE